MLRALPVIMQEIRNPECTACTLHRTEGNVCVMGRGNSKGPIMLIGEAPGQKEAETGMPFMGRSGQLLNRLLRRLHMQHQVYITNICKCRPHMNRRPNYDEVKKCTELYLWREIDIMIPEVIVLLGRTAIDFMFENRSKFRRHELIELEVEGRDLCLIATWHPAYVLRAGKPTEQQLEQALIVAKEIADADL